MNRTRSLTRGAGSWLIPCFPTVLELQRYKNILAFLFAVHLQFPLGFRLLFPLPPRAWSTTTARMVSGSRIRSCVPVLIFVVVDLRPAAVSYDQEVSKPIVNFSRCRRNSPRQVCLAPLSSSSRLSVIVDDSAYGKSS